MIPWSRVEGRFEPMYSLLIVDDEEEIRTALALYFPWNDWGFEVVHVAGDGSEALEYVRSARVNAALCDIRMPVMSGVDFARQCGQMGLDLRIVFLSAYKDFEYARAAMQYGVRRYVLKPVKFRDLEEAFGAVRDELDRAVRRPPSPRPSGFHEQVVAAIRAFVEKEYRTATLEQAAAHVRMNPNYLSTYYKQRTGENFGKLILRVKMENAARLLGDIRNQVQDVAALVGYSNSKNFARAFRAYFGRTPRDYRDSPPG
jgi:two-component system response regulator YesN